MTTETLDKIIEGLETIRKRKIMFYYPVDVTTTLNYFAGFNTGCAVMGASHGNFYQWNDIVAERGWTVSNTKGVPIQQMRDKGWTEEAIIEELFTIEILLWKQAREKMQAES